MDKKNLNFILLFLLICNSFTHSELLIIKKDDQGLFAPLSKEESLRHNDTIAHILLKYQWPMCIGSTLNESEKHELLTANQPYVEELFIQKKLQEVLPELKIHVLFVPTSLFDLFTIIQFFKNRTPSSENSNQYSIFGQNNPLNAVGYFVNFLMNEKRSDFPMYDLNFYNLFGGKNLLNAPGATPFSVRQSIQDNFKTVNKVFYFSRERDPIESSFFKKNTTSDQEESVHLYVNNSLASLLFQKFPDIQNSITSEEASQIIYKNYHILLNFFIQELNSIDFNMPMIPYHIIAPYSMQWIEIMRTALKKEPETHIIFKTISLEYQARMLNKALLLRGSSFTNMDTQFTQKRQTKLIAGSTIFQEKLNPRDESDIRTVPFWERYKEKRNKPYSIAFGTSLFAGFINDGQACAYYYLTTASLNSNSAGYVLFINKNDYIDHQNQNLFYIPSLCSLASLFEKGEYFHARTKAAISIKNNTINTDIEGLYGNIIDPTGILLITRDPLKHAEMFSNFLIENGKLIQVGDEQNFTKEEKSFVHTIMEAQKEVAQLYKAVRTIKPRIDKATMKYQKIQQNI